MVDTLEDLKKAQAKEDPQPTRDILQSLLEEKNLPMEFIVTMAGPTVKALRTHPDSIVKKCALALVKSWKDIVAADLGARSKTTSTAGGSKTKAEPSMDMDGAVPSRTRFSNACCPRRPCSMLSLLSPFFVSAAYSFSVSAGGGSAALDAAGAGGLFVPRTAGPLKVLPERVRVLNGLGSAGKAGAAGKPVVYWMSRDQRAQDNWALLYAQQQALAAGAPLAVCFCLVDSFLGGGVRHFGFMLRGLQETQKELNDHGIPVFLLRGSHETVFRRFVDRMIPCWEQKWMLSSDL